MAYRCTLLPREKADCFSRTNRDALNQNCPKGKIKEKSELYGDRVPNCCECEEVSSCNRDFICIECKSRFDCILSVFYGKAEKMSKNFVGDGDEI